MCGLIVLQGLAKMNHESRKFVITIAKSSRIRLVGPVAILVGKPEGKRELGRSKRE
jgi:hypothetical protein